MRIRLTKEWLDSKTNKKYPLGQVLSVNDEGGKLLIDQGNAEEFKAQAGDIVVETNDKGNLTAEDIKSVVTEVLAANKEGDRKILADTPEFEKRGGFINMADFAHSVAMNAVKNHDEKLSKWTNHVKATGMSESVSSDGGFLVPAEFRAQLMQDSLEASVVYQRCLAIPMSSNLVNIPTVDVTSHATTVFGGVVIYHAGEADEYTKSKPKFGRVSLALDKKLIGLCYVTNEMLEDSPISMEPLLGKMFTDAIAFQRDEDIINGTGAGMALGVLKAPCLVTQAIESGQKLSIATQNIVKMYSRIKPGRNCIVLANPDTFPQLATLTLNVGTGGTAVGLVQSAVNAPGMTILGKPLFLTEHCQTLGTTGDIIFADFGQYLVGEKVGGGMSVASSIHLQFLTDEVAYKVTLRFDGQPWEKSALTPKHSSTTLGSFIALGTRTN